MSSHLTKSAAIQIQNFVQLINDAFNKYDCNKIDNAQQDILINVDNRSFLVKINITDQAININLNEETKVINHTGMYVDYFEIIADIRRWFDHRTANQQDSQNMINYDVYSYLEGVLKDSEYLLVHQLALNVIVIYGEALEGVNITYQQDLTGYLLTAQPNNQVYSIGYQVMSSEFDHNIQTLEYINKLFAV